MVSHTGTSRFALFLLCCWGTLLSSHMALISMPSPGEQEGIIKELQASVKKVLKDYVKREKGVKEYMHFQMPCLTLNPQPPHRISSSAVLPYFRAIRPLLSNNSDITDIINHLRKLKFQHEPETTVSVPTTSSFEGKSFTLSVLKRFSKYTLGVQPATFSLNETSR
uniref:Interleukin-31 n=1 Tax=Catagonus wagneri TaxID=51154 RepID=A0A8C3WRP0_9CETA